MPQIDLVQISKISGYRPYTDEYDIVVSIDEVAEPARMAEADAWMRMRDTLLSAEYHAATKAMRADLAEKMTSSGLDPDDTVVIFLVDNSGSTRGMPAVKMADGVIASCRALEEAGIKTAVLAYSTRGWKGGESFKKWVADGKPANPGRLGDLIHIVVKTPDETVEEAFPKLALLIEDALKKENVDGEALMWAAGTASLHEQGNVIVVNVTDSIRPCEDATQNRNHNDILADHVATVSRAIEHEGRVALVGCYAGIGEGQLLGLKRLGQNGKLTFERYTTTEGDDPEHYVAACSAAIGLGMERAAEIKRTAAQEASVEAAVPTP